jgi:predicted AAA+ superfamily ATPase
MNIKPRLSSKRLEALAKSFAVVVVVGARQVGKTTLLQELFPKADYVVFDPVIDIENARSEPELFLQNHPAPVILDEIQYVPELVAALKRQVDKNKGKGQYFLTGSQQWGVLKSLAESLAGRAVFLDLEGFSLSEVIGHGNEEPWLKRYLEKPDEFLKTNQTRLSLKRSVFEQIWRGWMPETQELDLEMVPSFYQAYQRTYIERDVRLIGDVEDWQQFGRFVRLISALTAQEINFSQLGRDIDITPQTSKRWLGMLKSTFQWFEIPAYTQNQIKKISLKPKGYVADTGAACASQVIASPVVLASHPLWGSLYETAIVGDIRKQCSVFTTTPSLYHWRTHSGAEVDLIIEWNGTLYPIEMKATSHPSKSDTRGIKAFREAHTKHKIAEGLVICPTEHVTKISDHDYALPWDVR